MKKILINIFLIITFIIIYFFQVNLFSWLKIAGVMPNLFVVFVLFIGLFYNKIAGVSYGIVFGILLDLFVGKKVGISAIMLGTIGLIGGLFDKNFSKDSRFTIIVMVVLSTFFYEIGKYIISLIIFKFDMELIREIKILLIESLYNVILTIILYPLIQKFGYKIEEEYKGNKILTRYF